MGNAGHRDVGRAAQRLFDTLEGRWIIFDNRDADG
jgi:hypothetical protein